ncbi:MAG: hypothetical protein KF740_11070 [Ramlibacter sp.]|nr:hypothetical protein [Ramlibacter sp.]
MLRPQLSSPARMAAARRGGFWAALALVPALACVFALGRSALWPSEAERGQVRLAPGARAALARPAPSDPVPVPWHEAGAARRPELAPPEEGRDRHASARDLHDLFLRLSQRSERWALEEARLALSLCRDYARDADALKLAFAGGDPGPLRGPLTPDRQRASAELDSRCRGFSREAPGTLADRQSDLQARLQALGSPLADGPRQASSRLEAPVVAGLLASGGASAFEQARPALVAALARQAGVAQDSAAWEDLETAVLLASCELGRDCTAQAFESLRRCTWQSRCGQGLFDDWPAGLPAARIEAVKQARDRVLRAIRSGQAASLVWP